VDKLAALGLDVADGPMPGAGLGDAAVEVGQAGVQLGRATAQAGQEGPDHRTASTPSASASAMNSAAFAAAFSTATRSRVGISSAQSVQVAHQRAGFTSSLKLLSPF
jgi:hypothetical protein